MDVDLSLDEIIERKRIQNPLRQGRDKKLNSVQMKARRPVNKPLPARPAQTFDARNKIIQKTRAKIVDARDILNQNIRDSGIDARNVLLERKKERMPLPMPPLPPQQALRKPRSDSGGVHEGRFGQRIIMMNNHRPGGGLVQTLWNPKDDLAHTHGGPYKSGPLGGRSTSYQSASSRLNAAAKPFVPRGYVDYDNMQDLEDEEIARTLHLSSYSSSSGSQQQHPTTVSRSRMGHGFDGYDLEMDGVEITGSSGSNVDPFSIYEAARNRVERPSLLPPPPHVGPLDNGEKLFERRQRNLVASSNLPESLRARLFGGEPDRRASQGIYANENGSGQSKGGLSLHGGGGRRSPPTMSTMPLPLSVVNNKPGYRLLVSNLHSNVTTSDIRELFNDIGPMYDAHVVRPGTAEVIYKSLEHAEMAVEAYHQREFDGQPMHCVLVNPHSSNRAAHSARSRTVTTNSSGVEVDIDALHSVLFRDR